MFERIVEIIMLVMSESKGKDLMNIDYQKLQVLGYSHSEISTALNWLADMAINPPSLDYSKPKHKQSFRILHQSEQDIFTPEAWGEIIQMNNLGIINNEATEMLIDRAVYNGVTKVDTKMVKTFVAYLLFNPTSSNYGNGRVMLRGDDTIN